MLFFNRKHRVCKSGIFNGKTDVHCHLLPGVDDGSPDISHTRRLLQFLGELGYSHLWLTPHVMADLENTTESLTKRFGELKEEYHGMMRLDLAAEYMMDARFDEHLHGTPLRLGKEHLLVETSYISGPPDLRDILLDVWHHDFHPLIAHPERYAYMELEDYEDLKAQGYEFQLNLMSLSGYYGKRPKIVAEDLLERGMYDFIGSDLHHLHYYADTMEDFKLSKEQLDALDQLLENNANV